MPILFNVTVDISSLLGTKHLEVQLSFEHHTSSGAPVLRDAESGMSAIFPPIYEGNKRFPGLETRFAVSYEGKILYDPLKLTQKEFKKLLEDEKMRVSTSNKLNSLFPNAEKSDRYQHGGIYREGSVTKSDRRKLDKFWKQTKTVIKGLKKSLDSGVGAGGSKVTNAIWGNPDSANPDAANPVQTNTDFADRDSVVV